MSEKKASPMASMASTMSDGMDMMRKMWGMAGLPQIPGPAGIAQFAQGLPQALPSMITPTLDVGEMDKRIADLRAVEQWLNLNATMLRTTIQTLEVQRNTIATLKSFGGTVLASMNARGGAEPRSAFPAPEVMSSALAPEPAGSNANANWPPQRAPRTSSKAAAKPAAPSSAKAPAKAAAGKSTNAQATPPLPVNAAAWWGALQDQFLKVAAAAAAAPGTKSASKRAGADAPPAADKRKPRAAKRAKATKPAD